MKSEINTMEVIFDNGGGITLQTDKYAHSYEASTYEEMADQAAQDVLILMRDGGTGQWYGDNPDDRIADNDKGRRNGAYQVRDVADIKSILAGTLDDYPGHTEDLFRAALLRHASTQEVA